MNLLAQALSTLPKSSVQWRRATGRELSARGQWVTTYADPVPLVGSMQPLSAKRLTDLGIDASRRYWEFWTKAPVVPVARGTSGDHLEWQGKTLQAEEVPGADDWLAMDGWQRLVLVEVA